MSWRLPEGEAKLASAGRRIRRRRMSPEHANLSEAEGQSCQKDWRRRERKPAGLKPEQANPFGSCPVGASQRGQASGGCIEGQATQPALPPTQAANERAPSERGSEAERQRG